MASKEQSFGLRVLEGDVRHLTADAGWRHVEDVAHTVEAGFLHVGPATVVLHPAPIGSVHGGGWGSGA